MSETVLVVDDSKLDLFFLKKHLELLGVSCDEAASGRDCLRAVRNNEYCLILMDYMMPDPDGIETFNQIKMGIDNMNKATPIVAMVAADTPAEGHTCLDAGFDNYIEKPVDYNQLLAILIIYLPDSMRKKLKLPHNSAKKTPEKKAYSEPVSTQEDIRENKAAPSGGAVTDTLKDVEDIDEQQGLSLCGSYDAYVTALNIFYSSIDMKSEEIEKFYRNEDWENYTIKVHALKSSGNLIGADKLRADAKDLEDAGNAGDIDKIKAETEDLLSYYRGFKKKLSFLGGDEADDDKEEIPQSSLNDAYQSLLEFCESMDFDLADMVVKSMKEYKLPEKDAKKFAEIEKLLTNLDWENIARIIKE
ncbi:response regulator [Butyrivibrio sp. WCD3002]|uniref:response regulator n=1 Tax=Butyrivibrio sp. WCD3002 TaxID=1280676 RepID=UPI000413751E|nr:response regulator [Butyrivibrio sp. WCD3002]